MGSDPSFLQTTHWRPDAAFHLGPVLWHHPWWWFGLVHGSDSQDTGTDACGLQWDTPCAHRPSATPHCWQNCGRCECVWQGACCQGLMLLDVTGTSSRENNKTFYNPWPLVSLGIKKQAYTQNLCRKIWAWEKAEVEHSSSSEFSSQMYPLPWKCLTITSPYGT